MAYWLARARKGQQHDYIQRFDPRFWTVNFPRPMMAAVVTTGADSLRADCVFYRRNDLAGLIWSSEDMLDHPLTAYETRRDYRNSTLSFRWRSGGVIALDELNGPTLTIEGRDENGNTRSWYVRLWNYAEGSPTDATVSLNFSVLDGGFLLPSEADPVFAGDIDRMFISLAPPGYDAAGGDLAAPIEGWAEMSAISCDGARSVLEIGDVMVPPHGISMCTAFDDCGTQTPARLLRNIRALGYRGEIVHYLGMSHFFRLTGNGPGTFVVDPDSQPFNAAAESWHRSLFEQCEKFGFEPIASLSYELLAMHCPDDWTQRDADGNPALTGWNPPSNLLSPANVDAMAYLKKVAGAAVRMQLDAGLSARFQVGEPWWWIFGDGRICLYDDAARATLGMDAEPIRNLSSPLSDGQRNLLDAAGALLAQSTADLTQAIRDVAGGTADVRLLAFAPTILDPRWPEAHRANLPSGWAWPAFDRLQVEDYDWLTANRRNLREQAYAAIDAKLGYPVAAQDYLSGFVLLAEDASAHWPFIDRGLNDAADRGVTRRFVWASPQVFRDGYVRLPQYVGDTDMQPFDDIRYPLALGRGTAVMPEFSTSIVITASGHERRNSVWSDARLRFDVGPGIRSEEELGTLLSFFRARRGAARGFRLRDPNDYSSNTMTGEPSAFDQLIGIGDGIETGFPLVKHYGDGSEAQKRRITRPDRTSLRVSIDGVETADFIVEDFGIVRFTEAPVDGADVRAGFTFDVPVRFAEDQLEISSSVFAAGEAPSVPLVELREAV
jgi:uncharacterized protein (TIGR02217 family)